MLSHLFRLINPQYALDQSGLGQTESLCYACGEILTMLTADESHGIYFDILSSDQSALESFFSFQVSSGSPHPALLSR